MNTDKWTSKIDFLTSEFNKSFSGLTKDQLNLKPNPESWSIAQNIGHIMSVNKDYFPIMNELTSGKYKTPFTGKIPFAANLFGKLILNSVKPEMKRKVKTVAKWDTKQSEYSENILREFEEHQEQLKQLIRNCSNQLDKNIVISSPAVKSIVYRLDTAFDIIVNHEERHLNQAKDLIREVLKMQK